MTTNTQSLRSALKRALAQSTTALGALLPALALAGPQGEQVVAGAATVGRPDALTTLVNQTTQNAIVNWQSFDVGGEELVQFLQPNSSSVILNRVIGGSASSIFGDITANGHVFLVNTQGVYFAPGARVDVQGLFASTLDIANDDFLNGQYAFARAAGAPDAGVVNDGVLTAREGGYVVLAGDYASNTGVIAANAGTVALTAGSRVTLDLVGDGLINFAVDEAALGALAGVSNAGTLEGGTVVMTARVANNLTGTVVNNTGVIRAQSIEDVGGEVWLAGAGGTVAHSGQIEAIGGQVVVYSEDDVTLADGGTIAAEGGSVRAIAEGHLGFAAGAAIDADGGFVELSGRTALQLGGAVSVAGGTLVIDPATLTIRAGSSAGSGFSSTDFVGVGFIQNQLNANTDVHLITTGTIQASGSVTALTAGGVGALYLEIGTANSGPSNCVNYGVCIPTVPGFSAVGGGTINLSGVDINIGGAFYAEALNGNITLGDVTAASITMTLNRANNVTADVLTSTLGDVAVDANQSINIDAIGAAFDVALLADNNAGGVINVFGPGNTGGITAGGAVAITARGGDSGSGPAVHIGSTGINAGGGLTVTASASTAADAFIQIGGDVTAATVSLFASNETGAGGSVSVAGFVHATQTGGNVALTAVGAHAGLDAGKIFVGGDIQTVGAGNVTLNAQNNLGGPGAHITVEGGITANNVTLTAEAMNGSNTVGGFEGGQIFVGTVTGPTSFTGAAINATGAVNVLARGGVDGGLFMGGGITAGGNATITVFGFDQYGQVILADTMVADVITDYAALSALSVNIDADADMSIGNITATGGNITLQAVESAYVNHLTATGVVDIDVVGAGAHTLRTGLVFGSRVDFNLDATGTTGNVNMTLDGVDATGTVAGDNIKLNVSAGGTTGTAALTVFNGLNAPGNIVDIDMGAPGTATVAIGDASADEFNMMVNGPAGSVTTDDLTARRILIDTNGLDLTMGTLNAIAPTGQVFISIDAGLNASNGGDITMGGLTAQGRNPGTNASAVSSMIQTTGLGDVTINGNINVSGVESAYTRTVGTQSNGVAAWVSANFIAGNQGAMTVNGTTVNVDGDGTADLTLQGATVDLSGVDIVVTATPATRVVDNMVQACAGTPGCTATIDRNATAFGAASVFIRGQENAPGELVTVGNITATGPTGLVEIEGTNITAGHVSVTASGRNDVRTGTMVIGSAAPVAFSESDNLGQAIINIYGGYGGPHSTITTGNLTASGLGIVGITVLADDVQVGSVAATALASNFVHTGPRFTAFRPAFDQWVGTSLPLSEGEQSIGNVNVTLAGQTSVGLANAVDLDAAAITLNGVAVANLTLRGNTVDVAGSINVNATAGTQSGIGTASGSFTLEASGGQAMFNLRDDLGPVTANLGNVNVTGPAAVVDVNVANLTAGAITATTSGNQILDFNGSPLSTPVTAAYLITEGTLAVGHLTATGFAHLQNTGPGATTLNTGNITAQRVNLTLDNTGTSGPAVNATLGNVTANGSAEQGEINLSISAPDFSNGATLTAGNLTAVGDVIFVSVDGNAGAANLTLGNVTGHDIPFEVHGSGGGFADVGQVNSTRNFSINTEGQDISVDQISVVTTAHSATVTLNAAGGDISAFGISAQGHVSVAPSFVPRAVWMNVQTTGTGDVTIGSGGIYLRGTGGTYDRVVGNLTEHYDSAGWVSAMAWAGPSGTLTVNGDIDAQGVGFTYVDVRGGIVQFGPGADVFIDGTGQVRTQTRNLSCGSGCTELWVRESENHGGATFWVNSGSGAAPYAGATVNLNNVSVSGPFAHLWVRGDTITVGAVNLVADGRAVDTRTGSRTIGSSVQTFSETDSLGSANLNIGNGPAIGSGGTVTITGAVNITGRGQAVATIDADTIDVQGALNLTVLPETYTVAGDYIANGGAVAFGREQWQVPGFIQNVHTGTVTSGLAVVRIGQVTGSGSVTANDVSLGSLSVNGIGDVQVDVHAAQVSIDGNVTVNASAATVVNGAGSFFSSGEALIPFTTAGTGGLATVSLHADFSGGHVVNITGDVVATGPDVDLLIEGRTLITGNVTANATGTLIDGIAGGSSANFFMDAYGMDVGNLVTDGLLDVHGIGFAPSHTLVLGDATAPFMYIRNDGGGISAGTLTAINPTGPAWVEVRTTNFGGITLGGLVVEGQMPGEGGLPAAYADLSVASSGPNTITVTGAISITGNAGPVTHSGSNEFGTELATGFVGDAELFVDAGAIGAVDLGSVAVTGTGEVIATIQGGGGVTLGPVTVSADPANFLSTVTGSCGEQCNVTRTEDANAAGIALLNVWAEGGAAQVASVNITGPIAALEIKADTVTVGAITLTATGIDDARSSTGTGEGSPIAFDYVRVAAPVDVNIEAQPFSGSGSILLTGNLVATGAGHVEVELIADHVTTQNISLTAGAGVWTRSGTEYFGPSGSSFLLMGPSGPLDEFGPFGGENNAFPRIHQGTVTGGTAVLSVYGGFGGFCSFSCDGNTVPAASVSLGAVTLQGAGDATLEVDAANVTIAGPVNVATTTGAVNGTGVESLYGSFSEAPPIGSVARTVSGTFGHATVDIQYHGSGSGVSANLADVTVTGATAEFAVEDFQSISVGNVVVTGAGGASLTLNEQVDLFDSSATDYQTGFTGVGQPTAVDLWSAGVLSAGNVTVSGTGLVGAFLVGSDVSAGVVTVSATANETYTLFDTRQGPTPQTVSVGDVAVGILEGSCSSTCTVTGIAQLGGLAVQAATNVYLGVVADVTGTADIRALGNNVSQIAPGYVDVIANVGEDGPPEPLLLPDSDIHANGMHISALGAVLLGTSTLSAGTGAAPGALADSAVTSAFTLGTLTPSLVIKAGTNLDLGTIGTSGTGWVQLSAGAFAPVTASSFAAGTVVQITTSNPALGLNVETAGGTPLNDTDHGALFDATYVVLGGSGQLGPVSIGASGLNLGTTEVALITGGGITGAGTLTAAGIVADPGDVAGVNLITNSGSIVLADGGVVSINNGAFTGSAIFEVPAGTYTSLNLSSGGDLTLLGATTTTGLSLTAAGGITLDGAQTSNVTSFNAGTFFTTTGGAINAATLSLSGSATTDYVLTGNYDTLIIGTADQVTVTDTGGLTMDFGTGTYGAVSVTTTGGVLTLVDGLNAASATLSGAGVALGSAPITTSGALTLTTSGALTGTGLLTTPSLVLNGVTGTAISLSTNTTSIDVNGGSTVTLSNTATGAATLDLVNSTATALTYSGGGATSVLGGFNGSNLSLSSGGNLNLGGSAYTATGGMTLTTGGTFTSAGTISAGTLALDGVAATNFTINGAVGSVTVGNAGAVTINDSAGGLTADFGTGTYGAVSLATTGGALTLVDGLNAASATLSGAGVALGSAPVTTSGTLALTTTGALTGTGLLTTPSLVLNGVAGTAISLSTNTLSIDVNGGSTVTLSNTATGAATLDLLNSTATALTYTGGGATSVLGGFNGSNLSLTSGGNLTLGGSAYTATGTLAVSTPGTFTAGGALFTAGTLNLSGGSGTNFGLTTNAGAINVSGGNFVVLDNSAQTGALALTTSGVGPKLQVVTGGALTHTGGFSGTDLLLSGASVALGSSAYTTTGTMQFVTGGAFSATGLLTAGSLVLDGTASTNWGLDVAAANVSLLGGNTVQIDNNRSGTASVTFDTSTYGTVDLVFAGGAVLGSNLTAGSLIIEAGLQSAGDAVLAGRTVTTTGGLLVSTGNGGDIDVSGASLTAGGVLTLIADGDVVGGATPAALGTGPAPLATAAVGTLSGANVVITGDNILLGDTLLVIGNGASVPSGASDPTLRQGLAAAGLAPVGTIADGTLLSAGALQLGGVTMTGDYLVLQGSSLALNGAVSGPTGLVTQIRSATPNGSISLENTAGTAATLNLSTGTVSRIGSGTLVLGGGGNSGAVTFGSGGPVNLGALNFVAATSGTISDLALVTSTGLVRSLASLLGSVVVNPTPILTDIDPGVANPTNPVNTSAGTSGGGGGDGGDGGGEEEEDEEGEDTDQSGDTGTSEEEPLIKQESADAVGVCK